MNGKFEPVTATISRCECGALVRTNRIKLHHCMTKEEALRMIQRARGTHGRGRVEYLVRAGGAA